MSITVKEKEHWKERIAEKIERAINDLIAKSDPQYMERLSSKAREKAIESLGGTQYVSDLTALNEEKEELENDIENFEDILADLANRSRLIKKSGYYSAHNKLARWEDAVAARQAMIEKELLSHDPLGRQILKLKVEQETLLDTVWLSTSTMQIRALWKDVAELLSEQLSGLQQKVLKKPPVSDKEESK